jgi:hypothetical protein
LTPRPLARSLGRCLVAGLFAVPLWAAAQEASPPAATDWRAANDSVGEFRRGHADVLKWEQARQPASVESTAISPSLLLASSADAVRLAWQAHPELAQPLARLAASDVALIASGRWLEIDPALSVRIEHLDDVIEVAAQARKAWIQAVASQLIEVQRAQALQAAQLANELAERMAKLGNWSRLQQARVQQANSSAESDLRRARYKAAQDQASLLKLLQLTGIHAAVNLPDRLPELPDQPLSADAMRQRLALAIGQPGIARQQTIHRPALAALAFEAYSASHAIARSAREAQQLGALISEETQLHYNGMLKSSWDLLAAAQEQFQASASAIGAQRDFELAQIDLHWVLLGGEPGSLVTLGEGSANAASPAGH